MLSTPQTPRTTEESDMKKSELEAMNVKGLAKLIADAQARLDDIKGKEIAEERQRIQERCEELGVSIYQLMGIAPPDAPRARQKAGNGAGTKTPARPKYLLPDGSTFSGKGRIPLVLREALANVDGWDAENGTFTSKEARQKALEPFLIDK